MTSRYCDRCRRTHIVTAYEPEMPYDPRIPLVRLANIVLATCFLYAVVGVWVLSLLRGVSF